MSQSQDKDLFASDIAQLWAERNSWCEMLTTKENISDVAHKQNLSVGKDSTGKWNNYAGFLKTREINPGFILTWVYKSFDVLNF